MNGNIRSSEIIFWVGGVFPWTAVLGVAGVCIQLFSIAFSSYLYMKGCKQEGERLSEEIGRLKDAIDSEVRKFYGEEEKKDDEE